MSTKQLKTRRPTKTSKPDPSTSKVTFHQFDVPEDTHRDFSARCAQKGHQRSDVLRSLVKLYARGRGNIESEVEGIIGR